MGAESTNIQRATAVIKAIARRIQNGEAGEKDAETLNILAETLAAISKKV
jgi:hypothetical protein